MFDVIGDYYLDLQNMNITGREQGKPWNLVIPAIFLNVSVKNERNYFTYNIKKT
jgi:hypothetical protein